MHMDKTSSTAITCQASKAYHPQTHGGQDVSKSRCLPVSKSVYVCTPACCCSDDFFAAVKAAFTHPEHCIDPLLRKDYIRLVKAVNLRSEVFSKRQQAQLEVYSILVSQSGHGNGFGGQDELHVGL